MATKLTVIQVAEVVGGTKLDGLRANVSGKG